MKRNYSAALLAALLCGSLSLNNALAVRQDDKPALKSQAEVAAKNKTFGTIAATDAKVKGALAAKDLAKAKKLTGKPGAFIGTVVKVFTPKSNKIVILNFAENYKEALTAVVKGSDFAKFPNLETLKGKKVLISGKFVEYKESVEIELTSPDQVKVIK
jgi:hypothetical protein